VEIQKTTGRHVQQRLPQDEAVGNEHAQFWGEALTLGDKRHFVRVLRQQDLKPELARLRFDWARHQLAAATAGPGRRAHHRAELVAG
jgi:hypothetical protein